MQGKTHLAVGTAAALAVLQPAAMPDLFLGIGAALIGSVICDIDVDSSEASRKANQIIAFCVLTICGLAAIEWIWKIGILNRLMSDSNMTRIVVCFAVALILCAFGKTQPHRTFMHSFPALIALTVCAAGILPEAAPYFGVAFFSHMAIDFLNRKGLQLFYPVPYRFSMKLCSTTGIVDKSMRWIGSAASLLLFVFFFYRIGRAG